LSDVLIAQSVAGDAGAHRWDDLIIRPLSGTHARTEELALVWENYDFSSDSGVAKYSITIAIERQRSNPGSIVASIVRGIAGAVGVSRDENRFEITFDRTVAHKPVILENLALEVGDTPAGTYRLTVTVTDRISGRVHSRVRPLVLSD
jgi:hypothetical protein